MSTLILTFLAAAAIGVAQAPAAAPSTAEELTTFAAALESCTAATARTPHPFVKTFTSEHTIKGETAGTCEYRQTMPGKMAMVCGLSAEGRKALAADVRKMAGGEMKGSSAGPQPAWAKECEIELPSGARQPMVKN
jgi:hypothetical protein